MLKHLDIRNFAIIDAVHLDFDTGMTVLTGETGAGKSILIDALGLLLGDRADASAVRTGNQRAEISAEFDLHDAPLAQAWLDAHELLDPDADLQCVIRRSLTAEGRGRAFINGSPVTVRDLKSLGESLLDIHGQHAHQSLLHAAIQRELLDAFGEHDGLLEKIATCVQQWRQRRDELASIEAAGGDPQHIEFLRFQLQELEALNLQPGENDTLADEHRRLSHAGQLLEEGQQCIAQLYEEDNSTYRLAAQIQQQLEKLSALEPEFGTIAAELASPMDQQREAAQGIRDHLDRLNLDPERLQWLEQRIDAVHTLARKHRCDASALPDRQHAIAGELEQLEHAEGHAEALQAELSSLRQDYDKLATRLTQQRQSAGKRFAAAVQAGMRELGLPQGEFTVAIQPSGHADPQATGADRIEYQVRTNPGQPSGPLAKIASGGELSRIALAVQVVGAHRTHVPSLIFDEVDAGIGGGVAEIVGRQLHRLGRDRQTLCVTHLAQVAAQADQQVFIGKQVEGGNTFTRVAALNGKDRVEEISRMLGGVDITEATRKLARQMLNSKPALVEGG